MNGLAGSFMGTSCAAPLWAGFTALVNEEAADSGVPSVGFLNPALYAIGESAIYNSCFHDTKSGNNTWPGSPNNYTATTGYDLCTGWGTPAGQAMIDALVRYAGPVFVDFNYAGSVENGTYDYPFKTLAEGVNAVNARGTIFIKTAGVSSETMTISKPMHLTASDGAATIGR
jgi:subtilase family serine protease